MNKTNEKATESPSAGMIGCLKVMFGLRIDIDVPIRPGSTLATLFMETARLSL
jgi:hypothetical protein